MSVSTTAHRGALARVVRGLGLFAPVVVLVAVTCLPAQSEAARTPQVYIAGPCSKIAVKPRSMWIDGECREGANLIGATHVRYREYGRPVALAKATFSECLEHCNLSECHAAPCPAAVRRQDSGSLRFSNILHCNRTDGSGSRLFYTRVSFTFSGRPWKSYFIAPAGYECRHLPRTALWGG
jgi:hypothetical protein